MTSYSNVLAEVNYDDLPPACMNFTYKGTPYVLREPGAAAVVQWRNAVFAAQQPDGAGGMMPKAGIADTEVLLVSLCVFKNPGLSEQPITLPEVRGWPYRITHDLFQKAKEMAGIGRDLTLQECDEEIAKLHKIRDEIVKRQGGVGPEGNSPSGGTNS